MELPTVKLLSEIQGDPKRLTLKITGGHNNSSLASPRQCPSLEGTNCLLVDLHSQSDENDEN